jgi:hypothetical protein
MRFLQAAGSSHRPSVLFSAARCGLAGDGAAVVAEDRHGNRSTGWRSGVFTDP